MCQLSRESFDKWNSDQPINPINLSEAQRAINYELNKYEYQ